MARSSITCVFTCKSAETLRALQESARARIDLDEIITRTWQSFPGGIEHRTVKRYRLGDYFERIELLQELTDPFSLKLIFVPRDGVGSYWKDLMMAVLKSIVGTLAGVEASLANPS